MRRNYNIWNFIRVTLVEKAPGIILPTESCIPSDTSERFINPLRKSSPTALTEEKEENGRAEIFCRNIY